MGKYALFLKILTLKDLLYDVWIIIIFCIQFDDIAEKLKKEKLSGV